MRRQQDLRKSARAPGIVASLCASAISAVALCSSWPAAAGTNQFTLVGPEGGGIRQVQFHPTTPSIAYALTTAGYYRSTDSGQTWRIAGENLQLQFGPEDLAVDPSDPNRILFAMPGRGPLVSTDAGATLAQVGNFPLADARQVEFSADGSVVYASSGVRIVRSTDGGRTWSERTPVTANAASFLQFLRVDPLDPDVLYVFDLNQGGFRSTNGGGAWQPIALPANTFDVAITSTTPQRIWAASATGVHVSIDGGAHFPAVFPAIPAAALAIAVDPQNESVVYAHVSPHGLFRTPDGSDWDNVQGNARVGQVTSIAVKPLDSTKVMLGGTSGIVVGTPSTSGIGGTWERRDRGILAANAGEMSVAPDAGRIYINTFDAGVHFLADGNTGATPVDNEALQLLQPSAVTSSTFGLLAQSRGSDRLFVGISGGYARSDDGGDTWQPGSTGTSDGVLHFADSPGNPDVIVATTPALHRSIDGGDTWMPANAGLPPSAQATALVFSSASPSTAFAGIESLFPSGDCCVGLGVYKSIDAGASWSPANTGLGSSRVRALAVDPTNAQVVYAAADASGLLKTTDGGATWSSLDWPDGPGNTLAVAIDPDHPGIVYVAGSNAFARSVDGGATWQPLRASDARPEWQANALLADPRRPATLLVSTSSHGVTELTIAPDLVLESGGSFVSPLAPGAQETYRYRLRNAGPFHATGARVLATLPADATGISATTTNGACVVQTTTVTCTASVLETAATADIVVRATHPAVGTIEVLASASGDQADALPASNEVRYTVTVAQAVTLSPSGGGGGGGGGTSSVLLLLALAALSGSRYVHLTRSCTQWISDAIAAGS